MADMVKRFCNTFLVEGIFILIVGMLLIVLPQVSTLALSLMISVALILAGIYKLISSVIRRDEIEKSCPLLDGMMEGNVFFSKASTIVDFTSKEIKILRVGPISLEQIKKVINKR